MERKVRGHDGWTKDPSNGVVKCTNRSEYDKYMKGYWAEKKKQEEFDALQNDVSGLKSEMSDIKSLLLTLVQNQKGLNYDD